MIYPIPIVHKSTITTAEMCMNMLRYKNVLGIEPITINESSILGTALHDTIAMLHINAKNKREPWDIQASDLQKWFNRFDTLANEMKDKYHRKNIEVVLTSKDKWQEHLEELAGYMTKGYNRFAEPILIEAPFRFNIKRGKAKYDFAGTIDQLLKIEIDRIPDEILHIERFNDKFIINDSHIYMQRDIKSGDKHSSYTDIEFSNDLNVYSYALAYGEFYINGVWKQIKHIPYAHSLYYLKDHIKYKKKYGTHEAGDDHGKIMYCKRVHIEQLTRLEDELVRLWKFCNSGNYIRSGAISGACDYMCEFKAICIKEFQGEI